jgi:ribonuclease III
MGPSLLTSFQQKLQYQFKDEKFLLEALRHSSFVNEQADPEMRDNERLEFLGDAVLDLVVGHLLMRCYPDAKEGDLSRMRANLVNEKQLSDLAADIDLGDVIQFGKGELLTRGQEKKSILANTYEALVAAIYLDAGFDDVYEFIRIQFSARIGAVDDLDADCDFKSRLQERVQESQKAVPRYSGAGRC